MPRLIDADEIKKREQDVVLANGAKHRCFDTTRLFEIPTVDAVEVVRCKDCEHREVQVDGVFRYEMCGLRGEIINLDGFCHMGKRREDE